MTLWMALLTAIGCGGGDTGPEPICTDLAELTCEDEMVLDLGLQEEVSEGAVANELQGEDWVTSVDATAGGYNASSTNPWVYVRFTDQGAVKVEIDDEAALGSMEWHIAARRFVLRVNSGSSGPSCVSAAAFLERSYDELSEVPEGTRFFEDDYYTSDCALINDSSGLPGNPQVALGAWWEYPGCVATTDHPFLVRLEDGRVLRFTVERFYETGQEGCNASGTPGQGGALLQWRWRFLP